MSPGIREGDLRVFLTAPIGPGDDEARNRTQGHSATILYSADDGSATGVGFQYKRHWRRRP